MKDGCMHMYKIAIFFKRDFSFALGSYCENALFLHGVSRSGEKEKKPISYLVIVLSLYKPLGGGGSTNCNRCSTNMLIVVWGE